MTSNIKSSKYFTELMGVALFVLVIGLLAIRITKGIDFSDESYYAIFVSDWLINGISNSKFLTIHQTAALIVYPAACVYQAITGSIDGLFLFLRYLFLLGNIFSAIFWMFFLRKLGYNLPIWIGGLLVLSFIPFGLPAPSYNTIGSQALTLALAMLGYAILIKDQPKTQLILFAASALSLSIATIAYPPLVLCTPFLFFLKPIYASKTPPSQWVYPSFLFMILILSWSAVIYTLSYDKLSNSMIYLSVINDRLNYVHKLNFVMGIFINNKIFTVLCLISIIIGISRKHINTTVFMITICAILLSQLYITPVLFIRSHDTITLLTLTGLGLLFDLRKRASLEERTIALIYTTSLLAALITSITAFHSVFNFCIGAVPAAFLSILPAPQQARQEKHKWVSIFPGIIAIIILLSTSLSFYYGETPNSESREEIKQGFFKGIKAKQDDVVVLNIVRTHISPKLYGDNSLAIVSRIPGIVLELPVHIKMPSVFPLGPDVTEKGLAATLSFYENPKNRPEIVLIYHDPYFEPINPMHTSFYKWYIQVSTFKTPIGKLEVYQKL